jgi:Flp pilus assembly pilin Flp
MWFALWKIRLALQSLIRQEDGQDLVEYAMIILLCVVVAVASVGGLANIILGYFHYINTQQP